MLSHIKALGILHIVLSSLGVVAAVVVLAVFGGLAGLATVSDRSAEAATAAPVLGGIGVIVAGILLVISLPGLIGGVGLLKMAGWSRLLMIIISAIDLLNIPFGTAIGIYGLWVLTKPETQALLEGRAYRQATY